jgi:hypothetical protein
MKSRSIVVLVSALATIQASDASDVDVTVRSSQQTTTPQSARFEVVQSTLAAKATFRLDRYTGRLWELVKTSDDENAWQETRVHKLPQVQSPNRPRFQVFTSGLALRHTFLIDSDTGKTWVLVTGKEKEKDGTEFEYRAWQPFAE